MALPRTGSRCSRFGNRLHVTLRPQLQQAEDAFALTHSGVRKTELFCAHRTVAASERIFLCQLAAAETAVTGSSSVHRRYARRVLFQLLQHFENLRIDVARLDLAV